MKRWIDDLMDDIRETDWKGLLLWVLFFIVLSIWIRMVTA